MITGIGIGLFMSVVGLGGNVAPVNQIPDGVTKPTLGRLVYVIVSLIGFTVCACTASRCAKREKIYSAFYIGFTAGLFLWQALGEGAWHFGYTENGVYLNFIRLEATASLFLVPVFALFTAYLMKHSSLDFGVLCTLLSFLCDWFGHFILEGFYPFVSGFMTIDTFYRISGSVLGSAMSAAAVLLAARRYKDLKGRLLCSLLLYIGVSVIAFGFIE